MQSNASHLVKSPQWPYLAGAAVMTSFNPMSLRGMNVAETQESIVLEMLMEHAEPIVAGPAKGRWKLREAVRRSVLRELGSLEQVRQAVRANGDAGGEALVTLMESASPRSLRGSSMAELLALRQSEEWLIAAGLRSKPHPDLGSYIDREQFLEPLRRLTVGFQGRDADLRVLREYVDALASKSAGEMVSRGYGRLKALFFSRPPLVIHGPGGAGKSTLIAQFILSHLDRTDVPPMPFVRLDFDRSTLDPNAPDALLLEAVAQLARQFPEHADALQRIDARFRERFASEDGEFAAGSAHYRQSSGARLELSKVMNAIAKSTGQKILFVVDTFEIVQRRGSVAVYNVLDFVGRFLAEVGSLRVVIAGRAELKREQFEFDDVIEWQAHSLKGFDDRAGRAYLRSRVKGLGSSAGTDDALDKIVTAVRGNPLALRLAAQVLAREGAGAVEQALGSRAINEQIADEQIQGMLHARIVEHLDNDNLKKIANPGLVVRVITEEVIREVLAEPCGLDLKESPPDVIVGLLQNEFSLIERIDDHTLRHRTDVRELMLGALRRDLGALARRVDDLAVVFWSRRDDHASRAEELYHRLWRGDSREDLDARWLPGLEEYLQEAADEFEAVQADDWARIWLYGRVKRELPPEIRQSANQINWEGDTERRARALLSDGKPSLVLQITSERAPETWLPGSVLWSIRADSLLLVGNLMEAIQVVDEGLARGEELQVSPAHQMDLLARRVGILERLEDFDAARVTAERALELARVSGDKRAVFMTGLALVRLMGRDGSSDDARFAELRDELAQLSSDAGVQRALRRTPSLLRAAAAGLGDAAPGVVADALDRLGYEPVVTPRGKEIDPGWKGLQENASGLASLIREGRLQGRVLKEIAGFYGEVVRSLTNQTLK